MTRRAQRIVDAVAARACGSEQGFAAPWSGTFHSIANRLLRQYARRLGLDPDFTVLDRGDAADLMDVVRHELGFSRTDKRFPAQGHLPCDLFAPREYASDRSKTRWSEQFPWCLDWDSELTGLYREYVGAQAGASRCSTTTTCCSTGTS